MHELSITKALVEMVIRECAEKKIKPKTVVAELGTLTTYSADPVLFYYDILKKENLLIADSELVVYTVQGKIRCKSCKSVCEVDEPYLIFCKHCGSTDVEVVQGKDFKLVSIKWD